MWFVWDPLGLVCAPATWLLLLGGCAVLLSEALAEGAARGGVGAEGAAHGALSVALVGLALAAHGRTVLTDPGALPRGTGSGLGAAAEGPGTPRCATCDLVPPAGARHCGVCGRCIRRVDHHCPWVNNCVGEDNRKFFLLFTLFAALAALHALLLLGLPALRRWRDAPGAPGPGRPRLLLLLAALYGFLFAAAMFALQLAKVCADRTGRARGERGWSAAWMNLQDALGHPPSPAWLCPFVSPRPPPRASARYAVV